MAPAQIAIFYRSVGKEMFEPFSSGISVAHYLKGNHISKIVMSVNMIKHCASSTSHIYKNKSHTGINLTPPDSQPQKLEIFQTPSSSCL